MRFRAEYFMLRKPDEAEGWSGKAASDYQNSVADNLAEINAEVIQPAEEINSQVDKVTGK